MRRLRMWEYYYESGSGPIRNGDSRNKPAVLPSEMLMPLTYEELCELATEVVDWGQGQYHNDHGTTADHQRLVDFVNQAMLRIGKAERDAN